MHRTAQRRNQNDHGGDDRHGLGGEPAEDRLVGYVLIVQILGAHHLRRREAGRNRSVRYRLLGLQGTGGSGVNGNAVIVDDGDAAGLLKGIGRFDTYAGHIQRNRQPFVAQRFLCRVLAAEQVVGVCGMMPRIDAFGQDRASLIPERFDGVGGCSRDGCRRRLMLR